MSFIDEMESLAVSLNDRARVLLPTREESTAQWGSEALQVLVPLKRYYIDAHLTKIRTSDAVLVANYTKHGVAGYIGANSLMEAAFAHALGKCVLLLFAPGEQPCRIEALSIASSILDGDIDRAIPELGA